MRKRVADPELAEDILQDSLLRAIQAAPSLRQRDRLVPWSYSDLPNTIAVVVSTSLQVSAAILVEAGLGFLGLGDRTVVSLGQHAECSAAGYPCCLVGGNVPRSGDPTLNVMAANLVGDGLNAALDPRRSQE